MMKSLETRGKTVDDALAAALAQLGMDRDSVTYEILELPKSGFFGIGASPAVIRVSYELPDPEPETPAPAPAPEKPAREAKADRPEKREKREKPVKAEAPAPVPAPAPAPAEA